MGKVVFTNGCFDLLHPGHIELLSKARALGSRLVVGLNSDASVRSVKGSSRPIQSEDSRRTVLLALRDVDEVIIFDELTPAGLIEKLKPDVLVKGGDWSPDEIVGSDFVKATGGEVVTIPLLKGFSTTALAQRSSAKESNENLPEDATEYDSIEEHIKVMRCVGGELRSNIESCAQLLIETFKNDRKVLICGNGGSAADAQHISAEFVGRYETERISLPAIALTTDTSALTALANDYDFDRIFSRQVESLGKSGDCLIAISTSGNSPNIIAAVMEARRRGCSVIGMTGMNGTKLASLSDRAIVVPSEKTARIQEAHITIAHLWCETVDHAFAGVDPVNNG